MSEAHKHRTDSTRHMAEEVSVAASEDCRPLEASRPAADSTSHPTTGFAAMVESRSNATNASLAGSVLPIAPSDRLKAAAWGIIPADHDESDGHREDDGAHGHCDGTAAARIERARAHMPVVRALTDRLAASGLLEGVPIAVCLVLEPKTAVLLTELARAGARVGVTCPAGETDQEVADELSSQGFVVKANASWDSTQYHAGALALLDELAPRIIIDDGASFARLTLRERPRIAAGLIGVSEETTSGVRAFDAMAADGSLPFPVVAVNDSALKTGFDNAHGTGESCVTTMQARLGADAFDGKRVTVVGYGPVGRGFADRVRALGARVSVVDRDPVAALRAVFDGYPARTLPELAPSSDIVVSATGVRHTIGLDDMRRMRDGTVLAVIGGIANEIALDCIPGYAPVLDADKSKAACATIHVPDGPELTLLANGDGVNYTVGLGNPIEIMDLSFAMQLTAVERLMRADLPTGTVTRLGHDADMAVARAALEARGFEAGEAGDAHGSYDWRVTRFDE